MTLMISTVWGCAGPGGPGWGAFPLQCEREILRAPEGLLANGQKIPKTLKSKPQEQNSGLGNGPQSFRNRGRFHPARAQVSLSPGFEGSSRLFR